jgi:hypothetical protein
MLLIVTCWTRGSPTECINQTVAVISLYAKILSANLGSEHLRFSNTISYRQAHRLKQVLLDEIKGKKANCFAATDAHDYEGAI